MKFSSPPSRWTLALALCFGATPALVAQDTTPPYVAKPLSDVIVSVNSAPTKINLTKTFALTGVTGPLVRFSVTALSTDVTVSTVDVGMLTQNAPNAVATFLSYAHAAGSNGSGIYTYNNTLVQRAVPNFIVQGGGFYIDSSGQINQIVGRPTIASEAGVKNTRGTLAMALSTGPNSATGDFFFNVADNAMLDDTTDGGPFTVFGQVIGGLATLDAIEALPQENFSTQLGPGFENVPLVDFTGGQAGPANLVYLDSITDLPIVPKKEGDAAALTLTVANSNPDLVTASLNGKKLTLTYATGMTGTAVIKVKAKDSQKANAKAKFTVTVQ